MITETLPSFPGAGLHHYRAEFRSDPASEDNYGPAILCAWIILTDILLVRLDQAKNFSESCSLLVKQTARLSEAVAKEGSCLDSGLADELRDNLAELADCFVREDGRSSILVSVVSNTNMFWRKDCADLHVRLTTLSRLHSMEFYLSDQDCFATYRCLKTTQSAADYYLDAMSSFLKALAAGQTARAADLKSEGVSCRIRPVVILPDDVAAWCPDIYKEVEAEGGVVVP